MKELPEDSITMTLSGIVGRDEWINGIMDGWIILKHEVCIIKIERVLGELVSKGLNVYRDNF